MAMIRMAHRLGIPLEEVGHAFEALPHDQMPTDDDWRRLSQQWRAALDARIQALTNLRESSTDSQPFAYVPLPRDAVILADARASWHRRDTREPTATPSSS